LEDEFHGRREEKKMNCKTKSLTNII
jgi:hypothetical protein